MNELELKEPRQVSVYSDAALYNQCLEMAKGLAKSEIVPEAYRNKPESCLIALDIARQIGARSPLMVMQNLYIVKGKPSWSGQYANALVRANFKNVKSEITGTGDDMGCQVTAYDNDGNYCEGERITIKMAKDEGWWTKKDKYGHETSKWQTMPRQMLIYRAFSFFARAYCPEKLLGIHDEFENADIEKITQVAVNPFEDVVDAEVVKTEEKLVCTKCGAEISQKVADYSKNKYGEFLCMNCQKEVK